jgi:aspartyl-tRNA(Asn)/glutamyl-tRNA(Gln) amidotransferase subunit C
MVNQKEIEKLANLARIGITDEEKTKLSKNIESILAYVSEIKDVSSADKEVYESEKLVNVMREDSDPHESGLYSERLLKEAPYREGDYIRVKKIL